MDRLDNFSNYITRSSGLHWPNGRVPYKLESNFIDTERKQIASAILFFERNTCIRWVRKQDNDRYWVFITHSKDGCFSGVGFKDLSGQNELNLGIGCFSLHTIIHEMMHRIGFIHEQSRPDRDLYVEIIEENIDKCNKKNTIHINN
jgi:meprin B